ncbi:MAG TPA: hypothetical protein GX011_03750 [Clostridiales bacterium]|jgi:hypothetical protein|nr:hypothetical protein [Clostridiales bacterium]
MRQYLLPRGGNFYKVNMHNHTTFSDGKQTPEEVKELYLSRGYSAVAFTEHEGLIDFSYLADDKFIAILAYEYGFNRHDNPAHSQYTGEPVIHYHMEKFHLNLYAKDPGNLKMVCFNPNRVGGNMKNHLDKLEYTGSPDFVRSYTAECINEVISTAKDNNMFVVYNHPAWSMNTYPLYTQIRGLDGFEMFNGASHRTSDLDYTPYVYDHLARAGQRMVVVGGDDNHHATQSSLAWTMIKAERLTYEDLMDGLERGNCYASDGPEIYDLYTEIVDGQRYVHISCSEAKGIYLTTAGRRKDCKLSGNDAPPLTEATFKIEPHDFFFRLSVRDFRGNHANTRFYYLDELDSQPVAQYKTV